MAASIRVTMEAIGIRTCNMHLLDPINNNNNLNSYILSNNYLNRCILSNCIKICINCLNRCTNFRNSCSLSFNSSSSIIPLCLAMLLRFLFRAASRKQHLLP